MTLPRTLLIFGLGYSARVVASQHLAAGGRVIATVRTQSKADALAAEGIVARVFCAEQQGTAFLDDIATCDAVLVSVPPFEGYDPVLQHYADALARAPRLRWIGYLSTIGVYGDRAGAWVDETVAPAPTEPRSVVRAGIEQEWLAFGQRHDKAVHLFRIAGIYGPGRNALAQLAAGTARRIIKPGHVFNRIHVADIAQIVGASLRQPRAGAVYNLTDDAPAAPQDVVSFAAELSGIAPPPEMSLADAGLSAMGLSFYGECKRVRSVATRAELGVTLQYPTYREGLRALHAAGEGAEIAALATKTALATKADR